MESVEELEHSQLQTNEGAETVGCDIAAIGGKYAMNLATGSTAA